MSEMDAEMTVRFSATFNAVQNRFRSVFKEMFGGGDADLILTQPVTYLKQVWISLPVLQEKNCKT